MAGAIILAFAALSIPFLCLEVRQNPRLGAASLFVMLAHQIASCIQVTQGLPTMKLDPMAFHRFALNGRGLLDNEPYAQFLHFAYEALGPSHFLGCQISNLFFSIALVVQIRLICDLGSRSRAPVLTLIFGLPLSCVFNTSVTLREAAQMASFLSLAFVLLSMSRHGVSLLTFSIAPLLYAMHSLHQGFAAALVLILPLSLAWAAKARPAILVALIIASLSGGYFFAGAAVERLSKESTAFGQVVSGDLSYVEQYAKNVGEGRSDFGVRLDLGSVGGFLKTGPLVFCYYLYSPFPWQIRGSLDVYGVTECFLRLGLTYYSVMGLLRSQGQTRSNLILLGILFVGMEAAWAAGTANWGTAMRHRLPAWGLLVAAGGIGWIIQREGLSADCTGKDLTNAGSTSARSRRRELRRRHQARADRIRRIGNKEVIIQ